MARSKELTPREKEFAKEFVRTGNAYKSALKVGYDETTAKNKSYKWVDKEWKKITKTIIKTKTGMVLLFMPGVLLQVGKN